MKTIDKLNAKSLIVEAYRSIRMNIEYSNIDKNLNVILITSTQQNEGKSTIASNLAISFSKSQNKQILLIDGDLRNPSIHRHFCISNQKGLMDILVNDTPLEEVVYKFKGGQLDVLPTGGMPPNPGEILESEKIRIFLEKVRESYDYIFIDSPPIGVVSDAIILSKMSDGAIFVVSSGEVELEFAKLAKEKLEMADIKILGAILNKYENTNSDYGYYYSKYYGEEKKRRFFKKSKLKKRKNKFIR